ncbi:MAG: FAD binding domain-containing protein [Planctomycetota bacterium]
MKTTISSIRCFEPRTLREALAILRDEGAVTPLAGCTDIFVNLQFGAKPAKQYVNILPLKELSGIRLKNNILTIGSLTTYSELIESSLIQKKLPMLAAAAREVGGIQIQNRGTIGGNIANGSPAGDTLPVFAAADATVILISAGGERRIPFNEYYTGYKQNVSRPGELIQSVEVPVPAGRQWFHKIGTRAANAISKVVFAGVRGESVRAAVGSVGPTVLRVYKTEKLIKDGADEERMVNMFKSEIHPIDDLRSTAAYRKHVAANLLIRFCRETSEK